MSPPMIKSITGIFPDLVLHLLKKLKPLRFQDVSNRQQNIVMKIQGGLGQHPWLTPLAFSNASRASSMPGAPEGPTRSAVATSLSPHNCKIIQSKLLQQRLWPAATSSGKKLWLSLLPDFMVRLCPSALGPVGALIAGTEFGRRRQAETICECPLLHDVPNFSVPECA